MFLGCGPRLHASKEVAPAAKHVQTIANRSKSGVLFQLTKSGLYNAGLKMFHHILTCIVSQLGPRSSQGGISTWEANCTWAMRAAARCGSASALTATTLTCNCGAGSGRVSSRKWESSTMSETMPIVVFADWEILPTLSRSSQLHASTLCRKRRAPMSRNATVTLGTLDGVQTYHLRNRHVFEAWLRCPRRPNYCGPSLEACSRSCLQSSTWIFQSQAGRFRFDGMFPRNEVELGGSFPR